MSQTNEELAKREQRHISNTNSPQRDDAHAKSQEEYCGTVRSSVKSGRSKSSGVGIKLRHQPGPMDHLAGAQARGHSHPKARKTRTQPH